MALMAIETKALQATNTKGLRVTAKCLAGSVTLPWDYCAGTDENHRDAARALCCKLGWIGPKYGRLHMGDLTKRGYVFVIEEVRNDDGSSLVVRCVDSSWPSLGLRNEQDG